jgi:hypothetical protein
MKNKTELHDKTAVTKQLEIHRREEDYLQGFHCKRRKYNEEQRQV